MQNLIDHNKSSQTGQTLIETMVAAFILVMGIAAAIGLATYSLGATSSIRQQTVALGLAREGLEVVKNMRDTNWLRGTLSAGCHNFFDGTSSANCYPDWLTSQSDISGSTGGTAYYITFNAGANPPWTIVPTTKLFGLNFDASSSNTFYNAPGIVSTATNSGFARRITITKEDSFAPFNQGDSDTGPRLKVTADVWWTDKNCPMTDLPAVNAPCKITLVTYLTNWRNF